MSLKVCRGCLVSTGKLERITDLTRRVYYTICGLTISQDDGYPQYLCTECNQQMRKALAFRRKTRRAHFVLQEILNSKKEITPKDLKNVNRKITNLESSWNYWEPNNCAVYSVALPEDQSAIKELEPHVAEEIEKAKLESVKLVNYNLGDPPPSPKLFEIQVTSQKGLNQIKITVPDENKDQPDKKTAPNEELRRDTPEIKSKSTILVDIKPDNYKEIERLEEERKREEEEALKQIRDEDDDGFADDYDDGIDPKTIDLSDVFKDLEEKKKEESDDSLSEVEDWSKRNIGSNESSPNIASPVKRVRKKETTYSETIATLEAQAIVKNAILLENLGDAKIRLMTPKEQVEGFSKRKEQVAYKSSMFRCAMCIRTFDDKYSLMLHLSVKHKYTDVKCNVCQGGFKDAKQLKVHQAWDHWYEYTCVCNRVWYCLNDLVDCCNRHPYPDRVPNEEVLVKRARQHEEWLKREFKKVLLTPLTWSRTAISTRKKFICSECGLDYHSKYALDQHQTTHAELNSPSLPKASKSCEVCNTSFRTTEAMARHIEHNHTFMYKCKRCHRTCNRTLALLHICHKVMISRIGNNHCINCGEVFVKRSLLIKHQLEKYTFIKLSLLLGGDRVYPCGQCRVQFTNMEAREHHKALVHAEPSDRAEAPFSWPCKWCKKWFKSEENREAHVASCHRPRLKKMHIKCEYCDEILKSEKNKIIHLRAHHPETLDQESLNQTTLCDACGCVLSKNQYYPHRQRCLSMTFRCSVCPKTFIKTKECLVHILRNHIERPYCCGVCDMRFVHKVDAKTHILKIHAPEKLFECEICHVRFSCQEYKDSHKKKVHNFVPDKLELQKRYNQLKSVSKKHVIVYPHMKLISSCIPEELMDNLELKLSDYLDENRTSVPKEQVKNYFLFDADVDVHSQLPKKIQKQTKKNQELGAADANNPDSDDAMDDKVQLELEENFPEIDKYESVNIEEISYVRNEDGGFTKKTEVSNVPTKRKKGSKSERKKFKKTEVQTEVKDIAHSAFGADAAFLDGKSEYIVGDPVEKTFTNKEYSENEVKPARLEIDAQELAEKYEVVELDGVQYVNMEGVLYKIEYS